MIRVSTSIDLVDKDSASIQQLEENASQNEIVSKRLQSSKE